MYKKVIKVLFLVLSLSIIFSSLVIFAKADTKKWSNLDGAADDKNPNNRYLTDEEVYKLMNSDRAKIVKQKSDQRLDDAIKDIKNKHMIDDNLYITIAYSEVFKGGFSDLSNKYPIFADKELQQALANAICQYRSNVGDLVPIIFVKKDGNEVSLGYKDKDGNNILIKETKNNGVWMKDKKTSDGKPILDIDENDLVK